MVRKRAGRWGIRFSKSSLMAFAPDVLLIEWHVSGYVFRVYLRSVMRVR